MMAGDVSLPASLGATLPAEAQALILALQGQLAARDARLVEAAAQVAALAAAVRELQAQLGQTSRNSSRPPSADPPGTRRPPKQPPSGRQHGGQPGHRGRHRALLPPERVDHVVVVAPERCRHCKRALGDDTVEGRPRQRHQVVELPPQAAVVTEYQLAARRCPHCQQVTRATLPPGVPRRPFGPRLTATVALLSGRYRLSRREVQRVLRDLWGVELALGTVDTLVQAQSAALAPLVAELAVALPSEASVAMDETGWREGRQRAWLGTVVAPAFTLCRIAPSRGAQVLAEVLGEGYAGVVGCDRWSAYRRQHRALCHRHLKRAFQGLVDRGGAAAPIGRWGVAEEQRLFAHWQRFRSGAIDRAMLRRLLVPVQARFGRLRWRGEACGDPKAAARCRDLNASGKALWAFAGEEGVEPTNNAAERALRPAVLWRKGSFGSQSAAGSRFVERSLTTIATCRQQGRALLPLRIDAVEATLHATPAPSLLPASQG